MWCRERLRVIVFDKTAILSSGRALNCTNSLCFDEVSKYFCMACPSRIEFLPYFDRRPSGSLQWRINPLLVIEYFHLRFRCGRCIRRSHPATVHGLAMQDQRDYLLNVPELLWNTWSVWKNWGFKQSGNLFFGPPPFAREVIQALTDHCEVPANFALNSSTMSSNRTAPSSSRGIDGSCRRNLIMAFDTAKHSSLNFSGLMSIHFFSRTFDHDFNNATSLMKADLHIQDRADSRVSENPPSHWGCYFTSR